ncbi:aldehyde dehydrogenase family protein [Paenacidovorax monticola]|uniref:4-(hydroxymethyl)benzenesulfonate dehydrogenase n=1 Tax=Paenacidovorax monticola TaxID=1926868 RepID=A0A7H0HES6_9BURK|nr:aldehyde dehydrogenase family protein [Paenacidovorax monticola]QNP59042.1 aldehyde dehydrogenase family protein [Paenacidovorax monticola]
MSIARHHLNFIDGEHRPARSGQTLDVIDPADGQVFTDIPRSAADDVDDAVRAAKAAFHGAWGRQTATERGRVLMKLSQAILAHQEALAELECRDTGKPLTQARADIAACARYFEYYAGAADKLHGETIPYTAGTTVMAIRVPHGVTGHIIPWNYPAQIFGRSVGAALAAGNACVVKPAEDACLTPLRVAALALECGLPRGALNVVCGLGSEAGAALAAHPGIAHISFTGSTQTGAAVAEAAARRHIPVTLELGGKSPQIVFADADLEQAIPVVVNAIIQSAGQTCTAGSRVLIERPVYGEVVAAIAKRFQALRVGPGMQDLEVGPLVNRKQQQKVKAMVDAAEADGIRVAARAQLAEGAPAEGCYVLPTLLAEVPASHSIAQDEIFGPVLCAIAFDTEAEAIEIANGTDYGLTAGVWTRDGARQMRLAHAIEAGQIFINNYGAGGGIELPFGGMKHSGYGREKAFEGLRGFTTIKTIAIKHG